MSNINRDEVMRNLLTIVNIPSGKNLPSRPIIQGTCKDARRLIEQIENEKPKHPDLNPDLNKGAADAIDEARQNFMDVPEDAADKFRLWLVEPRDGGNSPLYDLAMDYLQELEDELPQSDSEIVAVTVFPEETEEA